MVRSIKSDGTLTFTNVGGPIIPTLDGEYCRIHTRSGKCYTGTILSNYPAVHVYKEARTATRDCENMHVRIDEVVKNKEDVQALGIQNGDYIIGVGVRSFNAVQDIENDVLKKDLYKILNSIKFSGNL